jgi:hypothetical protein
MTALGVSLRSCTNSVPDIEGGQRGGIEKGIIPQHVYNSKLQLNGFGKTYCVSFPFISANVVATEERGITTKDNPCSSPTTEYSIISMLAVVRQSS